MPHPAKKISEVIRFEPSGSGMLPRKDGTWVRLSAYRELDRKTSRRIAALEQDLAEARERAAAAHNYAREDLCLYHGAYNPEGDCLVCDKEQAEERARAGVS